MSDDHLETWDDLDLADIECDPEPDVVYHYNAGPERQAWVGGGTCRSTVVSMSQEAYERRISAQWSADVADATAAPLRL